MRVIADADPADGDVPQSRQTPPPVTTTIVFTAEAEVIPGGAS